MINDDFLKNVLHKMADGKSIYSAILCVENSDRSISWTGATGEMQTESRFFIASVTKLFVTAVVMRLINDNRLEFNDKISKHLPDGLCQKLHVLNGADYSGEITVRHLISNTSGLPDYFFHKQSNGRTVATDLLEGKDEPWPIDRTIDLIKGLRPKFKPGAKGKASYSDTNYQLLGRIIENITGESIGEVFHDFIISELKLQNTYAYSNTSDNTPVPFYYKSRQLWLPEYMTSISAEGGIVATAGELMLFLKAFFNGQFFPRERIEELKQWNLILPPPGMFYFGIGLEKLFTPRILSPFKPVKEILGFWGQTGSFAFHHPGSGLYICGTTNQINGDGHRAAGNAILKIIKTAL
jgi:D-alanyl-D-alanine carboxypeptidase